MKALLWLYSVLYLVPYCCVVAQDPREMLQSSSLLPNIPPWETTIEIPWLVSLSGNCQGIVLSGWWILSTANCLKKTELSNLEISGLYDIENILHGQNICLYPKFDSQGGLDPVKADIGLLLLQKPVWDEDITLSQAPNVSLRSCSRCQYTICQVHQYQSNKEFRTARVNKISVKLLDLQVCHHQYSQLEKNEGLCIQSQPQKDCWVQQSSPVLCLLKNHWEMVGLVHKTSRICNYPTVIIRTAPYLAWMKRLVKASKRLLNPVSSLNCRIESKHVSQSSHGHKYCPTMASYEDSLEGNGGISPKSKHFQISPLRFTFNDADAFTDSHKFPLVKSQTPQDNKFLVEQILTSSAAEFPESHRFNSFEHHQATPSPNTNHPRDSVVFSKDQVISNTHDSSKADIFKPLNFQESNSDESWDQFMADIIKQWTPLRGDVVEPHNFYGTRTLASWAQPSTGISQTETTVNIGEYLDSLKAYTGGPWNQPTISTITTSQSFPSANTEGPWKSFTSDETFKTTDDSWDSVVTDKKESLQTYLADSIWVPLPTGTTEPWSFSSEYYVMKPEGQSATGLIKSPTSPKADMDRLQILPVAYMGESSTPSKMVTDAPIAAAFEAQSTPYQSQSRIIPSQGKMPFRARIQPAIDIEPQMQPEAKIIGLQAYSKVPIM